jgi:hypothetical protein
MYAKKTTSGRMLGMCYILCRSSSVCVVSSMQGGLRGVKSPRAGVRGHLPQEKKNFLGKHVAFLGGFSAHGFCLWFSIYG